MEYPIFQLPAWCRLSEVSPLGRRAPSPSVRGIQERHPAIPKTPGRESWSRSVYPKPPAEFVAAQGAAGHSSFGEKIPALRIPGNLQGGHDIQGVGARVCCLPREIKTAHPHRQSKFVFKKNTFLKHLQKSPSCPRASSHNPGGI